jgi:hypothetical protein
VRSTEHKEHKAPFNYSTHVYFQALPDLLELGNLRVVGEKITDF